MVKRYYGGLIKSTPATSPAIFTPDTVYLNTSGFIDSAAGTIKIDVALIGGGGGGSRYGGGGGGEVANTTFSATKGITYSFTIGSGGTGSSTYGTPGSITTLSGGTLNYRALFGGGGGWSTATGYQYTGGFNAGGFGYYNATQVDYSPSAVGGYLSGNPSSNGAGGGGGGSGGAGGAASGTSGGSGGNGVVLDWLGTSYYWGGGGAGSAITGGIGGNGGAGGGGGGWRSGTGGPGVNAGANASTSTTVGGGGAGGTNTGGGGGGSYSITTNVAGNGGSGAAIIRYLSSSYSGIPVTTGSPTIYTVGNYTVYFFTASGTINFPSTSVLTAPASKAIVADATYNAQGWISGSTDYVGTTQNWAFTHAGLQNTSGGARTVTLPYDGNKYYMEIVLSTYNYPVLLFALVVDANSGGYDGNPSAYVYDGTARGGYSVNVASSGFVAGDTLNIAYNSTTNKVFYGKNGVWSIDPVSGTGATITGASTGSSVRLTIMCGSSPGTTGAGTIRKSTQLAYTVPNGYYSASL